MNLGEKMDENYINSMYFFTIFAWMMRETYTLHIYDKIKTPNPHLTNFLCILDTHIFNTVVVTISDVHLHP